MHFPATSAELATLPSGLRLILAPDDSFPVVSVQAWVATGSIHEDRHLGAGISHLLEHMVFKGTRHHDGDTLARLVQQAGGQWNAYTSFDHTVYHIDGPSDSLDTFLETVTGLVFFPTLPAADLARECDVIRREIDIGLDNPHAAAARLLFETAWSRDPRRFPVIGHRARFDALGHADLTAYHAARYVPANVHLVVAGRFDPAAVVQQATALTADAPDRAGAEPHVPADPPQCAPRFGRSTFRVPTSRVFLAWQTPTLDHPDTPALMLISAILGHGRSSRLYQRLREERPLALEIGAWCWPQADRSGLLAIQAECQPDRRDDLLDAARAEVAALARDPDPAELAKACRQTLAARLHVLATVHGRAAELGLNWLTTRDLDFTRRWLEALARVTTDDVRRAAARLDEPRLTTTILDPHDAPAPRRHHAPAAVSRDPAVSTLPNGLTLVRIDDARLPLASVQLAARAGLPAESPATSGIGQLLASMLPHGSASRPGPEIAAALEARGARLGARSGFNTLEVSCSGLAEDLPLLLDTLAEVARDPGLPADALPRELASQQAGLLEALDDPHATAVRLARAALFDHAGYGLEPLGSTTALAKLDRPALLAHHRRHFHAGNLVAAVVGDLRGHDLDALVDRSLATLPPGPGWQPPASRIAPASRTDHQLPKLQAALALAFATGPATAPDDPALDLLHHHCTDMAGPLFTRIREQLGLAYHVSAARLSGSDAGAFVFHLATAPEQLDAAEAALRDEIRRLVDHGLTPDELERTRNSALAALTLLAQEPAALARLAATSTILGLGPRHPLELPGLLRRVQPADVQAAAARWLAGEPVVARVAPAASAATTA